jgi:hypothetical protein
LGVKPSTTTISGRERELDTKTQTPSSRTLYNPSPKEAARRAKFQKLGAALTALEVAWRDRRSDHAFEMAPTPVSNDPVEEGLADDAAILNMPEARFIGRTNAAIGNTRRSRGPALKTVQFHRGVRRD